MSLYSHRYLRIHSNYGYSYTYGEIEKHLRNYSYNEENLKLDLNSPKSKIQLYYGTPDGFFYPHQYKIHMTQWESTLIPPNWVEHGKKYDEWWTANKFGADAFINSGVPEEKVHIFEHGVDANVWTPKLRGQNKKIRFLHVDSGSPRKRVDVVLKAFKKVFGDDPNYELTLKYSHSGNSKVDWKVKENLEKYGDWETSNVRYINEVLEIEDLISLYHFHDVLVYPSEGEGFGMIPLQALATGMPVISTSRWCSYDKYFSENIIDSKLGVSKIKEHYERYGNVVIPSLDSTMYLMKKVADDIENQSNIFYNQVGDVAKEYNWQSKTNDAMDRLVKRVGKEMFYTYKGNFK
jgi:glycosyltransferase involved in cell wall biosynthesis